MKVWKKANHKDRESEGAVLNMHKEVRDTYDMSRGVGVCTPLRLCAKLTPPPIWRGGFWRPTLPIGTPPPNAQPELVFANCVSLSAFADSSVTLSSTPSRRTAM